MTKDVFFGELNTIELLLSQRWFYGLSTVLKQLGEVKRMKQWGNK